MYSGEKSSVQTAWLSTRFPATPIALGVRLALPGPKLQSAAIGLPPNIPERLLDILWLQGLSEGFHSATSQTNFPLSTSSIEVSFTQLEIPIELNTLSDDELETLRLVLASRTESIIAALLTEMLQVERPVITLERSRELIFEHSGLGRANDNPAMPGGLVFLLNDGYVDSMAHTLETPAELSLLVFSTAFEELMIALATFADDYRLQSMVDKEIVAALWEISFEGRRMARANVDNRPSDNRQQWVRVGHWLDTLTYVIECIVTDTDLSIDLLRKIAMEPDYEGPMTLT